MTVCALTFGAPRLMPPEFSFRFRSRPTSPSLPRDPLRIAALPVRGYLRPVSCGRKWNFQSPGVFHVDFAKRPEKRLFFTGLRSSSTLLPVFQRGTQGLRQGPVARIRSRLSDPPPPLPRLRHLS